MSQLVLGDKKKEKDFADALNEEEEIHQIFQEAEEMWRETQRPKEVVFGQPLYQFTNEPLTMHVNDLNPKTHEIEVRFGTFSARRHFIPGVAKEYFYNLLNKMQEKMPNIKSVVSTTYISQHGIRITETDGLSSIDKKTNIKNLDYPNWGVRLSVSKEESLPPKEIEKNKTDMKNWTQRRKTRWSFPLKGRSFDLTITLAGTTLAYEVEIEYSKSLETAEKDVMVALQHMQKASPTNVLSDHNTSIAIVNFNRLLSQKTYDVFDRIENKPVSFEWSNVFYGGEYYITPKLDGVRKRLFFDINGVFEVSPGGRFIRQISSPLETKTIIDTEFFNGKYYPFDALAVQGELLINQPFATRLNRLLNVVAPFLDLTKPFFNDGFYKSVDQANKWMAAHKDLQFDGLIAQSNEPVYAGTGTMKIKPLDELTVDLATRIDEKNQVRLYSSGKDGLVEENLGKPGEAASLKTEYGRYTVTNLKLPKDTPKTEFIAEYRFINKAPYLRFKGFRNDKIIPNYHGVVKNVYRDYFIDPVSIEDFIDGSLVPWRKWASSVKRRYIDLYVAKGVRVLDIGIGRGGTMLATARKASVVYGIDPDTDNIDALNQRIATSSRDDQGALAKLQILKGKGQETKKILDFIGSPVDVTLSFFSLSFFYKSEKELDQFVQTCSTCTANGGKLIVMFMDGERVRGLLEKGAIMNSLVKITSKSTDLVEKNIVGVPITIELLKEKDPIFKKQSEWLAPMDVLVQKLKVQGFTMDHNEFMDKDAVLPAENLKYAGLNRVIVFSKNQQREGNVLREDFQIKTVAIGQEATFGENWIRYGVVWDESAFLRSFLWTVSKSYRDGKDTDAAVVNLRNELIKVCTKERFAALKGGNVQGRIAFEAFHNVEGVNTKERAVKYAYKAYIDRLKWGPIGHEVAGLLLQIYPASKIIVIDEDYRELDSIGTGKNIKYILKVGNYGYSPLTAVEGYKHTETEKVEKKETDLDKWHKAVKTGDQNVIDEMIITGFNPAADDNVAIKTAVMKKDYSLVKMLAMLVNLDEITAVGQDLKGKPLKRSLREQLTILSRNDPKVIEIVGKESSVRKRTTSKKIAIPAQDEIIDEDEGFMDDELTDYE